MLFFSRGKALKNIEEGLRWKAGASGEIPGPVHPAPEGLFIQVPALNGQEQLIQYVRAVGAEAAHVMGRARPEWVHLQGEGVGLLPINGVRAVLQAVSSTGCSAGLDICPAYLEPGAIAGWRSVGVERINLRVDGPFMGIDEPVRRTRALGAFVSVEICFGGELAGRAFLQAVERSIAASPNQISVSDERNRGAFGAEYLERAGDLCSAAGFHRVSLWAWARGEHCFDCFGKLLSGRSAAIGPGAVMGWPAAYANPGLQRWMETRLDGNLEAARTDGKLEQWLALASGLYRLELKRGALDCRLHRHALMLERLGVVDRRGRPADGSAMEFCHRAVRAARLALLGSQDRSAAMDALQQRPAAAIHKRG